MALTAQQYLTSLGLTFQDNKVFVLLVCNLINASNFMGDHQVYLDAMIRNSPDTIGTILLNRLDIFLSTGK